MSVPERYQDGETSYGGSLLSPSPRVTQPNLPSEQSQSQHRAGSVNRVNRKRRHEQMSAQETPSLASNVANLDLPPVHDIYYEAICTRAKDKNDKKSSADRGSAPEIRVFKKIPGAASIEDARAGGYLNYQLSDKKIKEKSDRDKYLWQDDVERSLQRHLRRILPMARIKVKARVRGETRNKNTRNPIFGEFKTKYCGRNELLSVLIENDTGVVRDRKQIGSHLQVLRNKLARPLDKPFKDENGSPVCHQEIAAIYAEWGSKNLQFNPELGLIEPITTDGIRSRRNRSARAAKSFSRSLVAPDLNNLNCHAGDDDDFYFVEMQFGVYVVTGPNDRYQNILHHYASTSNPSSTELRSGDGIPNPETFYPQLLSLNGNNHQEQVMICEASLNLRSEFTKPQRHVGTTMRASVHYSKHWNRWWVRTTGYLNRGEEVIREERDCTHSRLSDNFIDLHIHACPSYWAQILTDCAWVEEQCIQESQTNAWPSLSVSASTDSASSLHQSAEFDALRRPRIKRLFDSASFVQEIFAGEKSSKEAPRRVVLILWKFSEAPENTAGSWAWKRMTDISKIKHSRGDFDKRGQGALRSMTLDGISGSGRSASRKSESCANEAQNHRRKVSDLFRSRHHCRTFPLDPSDATRRNSSPRYQHINILQDSRIASGISPSEPRPASALDSCDISQASGSPSKTAIASTAHSQHHGSDVFVSQPVITDMLDGIHAQHWGENIDDDMLLGVSQTYKADIWDEILNEPALHYHMSEALPNTLSFGDNQDQIDLLPPVPASQMVRSSDVGVLPCPSSSDIIPPLTESQLRQILSSPATYSTYNTFSSAASFPILQTSDEQTFNRKTLATHGAELDRTSQVGPCGSIENVGDRLSDSQDKAIQSEPDTASRILKRAEYDPQDLSEHMLSKNLEDAFNYCKPQQDPICQQGPGVDCERVCMNASSQKSGFDEDDPFKENHSRLSVDAQFANINVLGSWEEEGLGGNSQPLSEILGTTLDRSATFVQHYCDRADKSSLPSTDENSRQSHTVQETRDTDQCHAIAAFAFMPSTVQLTGTALLENASKNAQDAAGPVVSVSCQFGPNASACQMNQHPNIVSDPTDATDASWRFQDDDVGLEPYTSRACEGDGISVSTFTADYAEDETADTSTHRITENAAIRKLEPDQVGN